MPSVAIVTLGCPKNQVDSEAMASLVEGQGLRLATEPSRADVIIVNTCGFIEPARQESFRELRSLAAGKRRGQRVVAAGCLAELNPGLLMAEVPGLDGVLGTKRWHEIGEFIRALSLKPTRPPVWTGESPLPFPSPDRAPAGATAYVKIAEGCSGPCAFCTIPRIKGPFRSRPSAEIIAETADLVRRGYEEIILVAQNTTFYGRDRGEAEGLAHLVGEVLAASPELPWLRLMYTYPQHISDLLLETMAADPRICHYVDLPLQHAHPDVLRRMRRPSDPEAVLRLIERLRTAMPDVALRTAFIVGFPGETEAEFEALVEFVREVKFDHLGVFSYSPEPGTPAYDLEPSVPESVTEERSARLMEEQQSLSLAINASLVGRELPVLVEGNGDGISVGRTYRDAPEVDGLAIIAGEFDPGQFVQARVTRGLEYDLLMEPVDGA